MGIKFTTFITRCTPLQDDSDDEQPGSFLNKIKKKAMQKFCINPHASSQHQSTPKAFAKKKYAMPKPSIIIPPPITINPTISQLLAQLTPTYSQAVHSIISMIEPESNTDTYNESMVNRPITISYNPNLIMHISSNDSTEISPLSTQEQASPILLIDNVSIPATNNKLDTPNNTEINQWNSDADSDSDNSISMDGIDGINNNEFSDWCNEEYSQSDESFVKID